jgi:hypothetical protein
MRKHAHAQSGIGIDVAQQRVVRTRRVIRARSSLLPTPHDPCGVPRPRAPPLDSRLPTQLATAVLGSPTARRGHTDHDGYGRYASVPRDRLHTRFLLGTGHHAFPRGRMRTYSAHFTTVSVPSKNTTRVQWLASPQTSPAAAGSNEMDPPFCGPAFMSHNGSSN